MPALANALRQISTKLQGLHPAARAALERVATEDRGSIVGESAYVDVKVQMLLAYLTGLVYYLLLKVRGVSVRDHPVVLRILWIRSLLEKLRPVDQKLQYQISKLLQLADAKASENAQASDVTVSDPRTLKPGELAQSVEDEPEEETGPRRQLDEPSAVEDDGIYRPPKISQVEYTGDHITEQERAERDLERKKRRLEQSDLVRSLREEFTDAPAEVHGTVRTAKAERASRKIAEMQEYEEDNMVRLRMSKKEMKEQRNLLRQKHVGAAGVVAMEDAFDFRELAGELTGDRQGKGSRKGKGKGGRGRGGTALREYQTDVCPLESNRSPFRKPLQT